MRDCVRSGGGDNTSIMVGWWGGDDISVVVVMAREKVVMLDTAFLPGEIAHRNESERHHRLLHHTLGLRLCNGKGRIKSR